MGGYLVGVDMGTGSTKGVLVEADGTVVDSASRPHQMSLPRPRWAEMDAEADWWGDTVAVIRARGRRRPVCDHRRVRVRPGPLPARGGLGRPAAARRDPLRDRHAGDRGDHRADRALRRGRDPRAL